MTANGLKLALATSVSVFGATAAVGQVAAQASDVVEVNEAIVVTAQRRSESIIEVPISVSVVTGDQLAAAGISNSADLRLVTPGLNITQQGSFVQPTIRGVGTSVVGPGADGNIALYVDGVYQAVQAAAMFELNDIESIQVLKGPQGTLYGRNATGGAMVVTTRAPSFVLQGQAGISYGRYNELRLTGYVTGPLSDTLAASLSVVSRTNEGYTSNIQTGNRLSETDAFAVRGKLLWKPSDVLQMTLSASYVNHKDNTGLTYLPDDYNFAFPNTVAAKLDIKDGRVVSMDFDPYSQLKGGSIALNIVYEPEWGTITSSTSYTDLKQPFFTDTDGTEIPVQIVESPQTQQTFYQELTLASRGDGAFSWITGITYYNDHASSFGTVRGIHPILSPVVPITLARLQPTVSTDAFAIYGEGSYNIADGLHITLGGRYNYENKRAIGTANGIVRLNAEQSWSSFTPRASIRYDLSDKSSMYATYSQGFKSGMFNATALDNVPVNPEKIKSYEIGFKYGDSAFLFTAAGYYYDYNDIQVNAVDQTRGAFVTVTNAGNAEIYGIDVDLSARISDNFDIRSGAAWIHGRYTKFDDAIFYIPQPDGTGFDQIRKSAAGQTIVKTPEFTAFATLMYNQDVGKGSVNASMTGSYNTGWYWDPSNISKQDAFFQLNARLGWSPTETFTIGVWGENLTDSLVEVFRRQSSNGEVVAYGRPLSYGIEASLRF